MNSSELRDYFTDAIRFWEPRRVIYNLALAGVVVAYFVVGYPGSKAVLSIDFALGLFLLTVGANICYCAAYLPTSLFRPLDFAKCGSERAGFCLSSAP
jgi:hypothetical protein